MLRYVSKRDLSVAGPVETVQKQVPALKADFGAEFRKSSNFSKICHFFLKKHGSGKIPDLHDQKALCHGE